MIQKDLGAYEYTATITYPPRSLFSRVREFALVVRTLLVLVRFSLLSRVVRTSSRRVRVRGSRVVRTSANAPANYAARPSEVNCLSRVILYSFSR